MAQSDGQRVSDIDSDAGPGEGAHWLVGLLFSLVLLGIGSIPFVAYAAMRAAQSSGL